MAGLHGLRRSVPFVAGARVEDWPLPDPKGRPLAEVRTIRDDIAGRVADLVAPRVGREIGRAIAGHEIDDPYRRAHGDHGPDASPVRV